MSNDIKHGEKLTIEQQTAAYVADGGEIDHLHSSDSAYHVRFHAVINAVQTRAKRYHNTTRNVMVLNLERWDDGKKYKVFVPRRHALDFQEGQVYIFVLCPRRDEDVAVVDYASVYMPELIAESRRAYLKQSVSSAPALEC